MAGNWEFLGLGFRVTVTLTVTVTVTVLIVVRVWVKAMSWVYGVMFRVKVRFTAILDLCGWGFSGEIVGVG